MRAELNLVNVALNLYSIVICLMMTLYLLTGIRRSQKLNRLFGLMCILNICMSLGDMSNWLCEGFSNPWNPILLRAGTFLYFICACPLLLTFISYLSEYLGLRTQVKKTFLMLSLAVCICYTVTVVLSMFNGMFFWFDENNYYQRGEWFWLSQLLPMLSYGITAVMIHTYRRCLDKKTYWILMSYIILPVVGETIQIFNYGIALLNTSIAIALLTIFTNVQIERENRMKEQEAELAQSRIDIMLSQIQPHFLFNSLTVIRQLCETDPMQAKQAVFDLSRFLRVNMESLTDKRLVSFEQELNHVKHYLNLEKQRFQERLQIRYDIEELDFMIPPLTVQPLVENAVRHGILKRDEGGTVIIRSWKTQDGYFVEIWDDGVGVETLPKQDGCDHLGIENVRSRLDLMCKGTLKIDSKAGQGTTVTIKIPGGYLHEVHISG